MTTNSGQQHWPERAMEQAEAISDAWEVAMTYAGHLAKWVLFGCLVANLVEVVVTVPDGFGGAVLIVQAITLDIAGFGLATMGAQARRQGNRQAARTAGVMGWTLISIMLLTVGLVTLAVLRPETKSFVHAAEDVLILVRVLATVLYGHVIHSLREAKQQYTNQVTRVQEELDNAQQQVSSGQAEVSRLRAHLDTKNKEVDSLRGQVSSGQGEVSTLRTQLDTLRGQVDSGQAEVDTLRRQLQSALAQVERVRTEVREKQHEPEGGRVSSGQAAQVSTRQAHVDSGQVIPLDRNKRERGQQEAEQVLGEHIKALLSQRPELSNRAIASKLACSPTTVGKWRKSLTSASVNEEAGFA